MTDWSDSTVYLPYVVEIERDDGEVRAYPAHFVTLTPDFVFVRDPAGGFDNLPARSVRSARVSRHRIDPVDLYRLGSWGFAGPLTGYQLERAAVDGGPALPEDPDIDRIELDPDRLAPHFRTPPERRVNGEYLVSVRGSGEPLTVAARAGVSPQHVFDGINGFAGAMTDDQLRALRQDPDVDHIEDNGVFTID